MSEFILWAPTPDAAERVFAPIKELIQSNETLADIYRIDEDTRTITHIVTEAALRVAVPR